MADTASANRASPRSTLPAEALSLLPGVPPELLLQYEQTPSDLTLVCALADAAAEQGLESAADCLRWVAAKGRWPVGNGVWTRTVNTLTYDQYLADPDKGWFEGLGNGMLPRSLEDAYDAANGDGQWACYLPNGFLRLLCRLLRCWSAATVADREVAWQWQTDPDSGLPLREWW